SAWIALNDPSSERVLTWMRGLLARSARRHTITAFPEASIATCASRAPRPAWERSSGAVQTVAAFAAVTTASSRGIATARVHLDRMLLLGRGAIACISEHPRDLDALVPAAAALPHDAVA